MEFIMMEHVLSVVLVSNIFQQKMVNYCLNALIVKKDIQEHLTKN